MSTVVITMIVMWLSYTDEVYLSGFYSLTVDAVREPAAALPSGSWQWIKTQEWMRPSGDFSLVWFSTSCQCFDTVG